jgi:hypothetical protein
MFRFENPLYNMLRFIVFSFLLMFFFNDSAFTQSYTDCLDEAKKNFDAGQVEKVKEIIVRCFTDFPKVSNEKKEESYKLLTESYLFSSDIDNGQKFFEKMLRINPLFEADSTDPGTSYDLIYLSRTYRRNPLISVYANAGANYSMLEILQNYNTDNNNRRAQDYKQFTLGFNAALGFEIPVWNQFTFAMECNFAMRSYLYNDTVFMTSNLNNPRQAEYQYGTTKFNEQQLYIDIPLMVRYEHYLPKFKKIIPYLYAGITPNFLLSANLVNVERSTSRETLGGGAVIGGENIIPVAGPDLKPYNGTPAEKLELRNKFNISGILGAGAKIRVGSDFIILEARYNRFILNSVNLNNRYNNKELVYQFGYVDNDFRMDNFSLTLGFEKSFYEPRKKRKFNPDFVGGRLEKLLKKEKQNAEKTTDAELKRELNSYIRELQLDKPGIIEDVKRGRASSNVILDASKEFDKIKGK